MAKTVQLRISDIKLLTSLQIRLLNEDHVQSLMETPDNMEPIVVYDLTDKPYDQPVLVSGHHRRQARLNLGQDQIWCERREGNFSEALIEAIVSNTKHGLPLTLEEKKSACRLYLTQFPEHADSRVSKSVSLSDKTVHNIRTAMESRKDIPVITNKVGLDDKERGPRKSSKTSGNINLHWSVNFASESQMEFCSSALVQAGKDGNTDKAARAFELMSADYLSAHPITNNGTGGSGQGTIKMSNHDEV